MIGRAFNPPKADSVIIDLEGWNDVLDALADSKDEVPTNALRMVSNAITDCIRQLRVATDLAEGRR